MNDDEEWQRWTATYARAVRPMPPVMKRARTDRRRAFIGLATAYAIAALLALTALRELLRAQTATALASPLFTVVCLLVILMGTHAAMRGTLGSTGGAPLQLLADLQRRHTGRRRLLRFLPWVTGLAIAGTVSVDAATMIATRRFDLASTLGSIAVCGVTACLVWLTVKRVGKLIDRELREAAEARALLTEGPAVGETAGFPSPRDR